MFLTIINKLSTHVSKSTSCIAGITGRNLSVENNMLQWLHPVCQKIPKTSYLLYYFKMQSIC